MKTSILLAAVAALPLSASAATSVENVTVRQHWPWNGLVDIDSEIVTDDPSATFLVYPKGEDRRLGTKAVMRTLSGDGADGPVGPGVHRMVWDAKADMPGFHTPDFAVSLQTVSSDAEYLVVDLSGGTNAVTFPVHYSPTGPDIANDKCRTTELWLRLVMPGTFLMGSPADEKYRSDENNDVQHQVTLTRPFYLGVFELTQMQWQLVMGTTNAFYYTGPCRPVDSASFAQVRGVSANGFGNANDDIAASSFFGVMRRKAALPFDLPTESQWEYACRAGTTTAWNDGSGVVAPGMTSQDSNLNRLGRYNWNISDGQESYTQHTKVGLYQPNAWGFFDMHGNVCEWCRDAYRAKWATDALIDPEGGDGATSRVLRGGAWSFYQSGCHSGSRTSCPSTALKNLNINPGRSGYSVSASGSVGFRVGCFPVE